MAPNPQQSGTIPPSAPIASPTTKKLRWLGLAAFLFFLIKGLAWLVVPALLVWWHAATGS